MNRRKGFTLLEVLVVTVIAASVLLFAVPAYKRSQDKSLYTAALGVLMELRGGVLAMRQDLRLAREATGQATIPFPADVSLLMQPVYYDQNQSGYGNTVGKGMESQEVADNLPYAFFSHGYMQPIPFDDTVNNEYKRYKFYICSGAATQHCCSSANVVACMEDPDSCTTRVTEGLYYGARIDARGAITQVSDACSSQQEGNS